MSTRQVRIDLAERPGPRDRVQSSDKSYFLWTIGCQMNTADSEKLSNALDHMGLVASEDPETADLVVLNSCVVRKSAEDKVTGMLGLLKPMKLKNPEKVVALMGCMVGPDQRSLKKNFPHVDLFMTPRDYNPLLSMLGNRWDLDWEGCLSHMVTVQPSVSVFIPIIHGCDLFCSFCIIPYRRGRQRSEPIADVVKEARLLVNRGAKEITVLGQTVDAYGYDLEDKPDLADLLKELNEIDGLMRIRFLTSHPNFMTDRIIDAVASLDKVCEQINLPIQAGHDELLLSMRRGYTQKQYYKLIEGIRTRMPRVSLSTDVIVGFCGETQEHFNETLKVLEDIRFDKVHVAAYSTRSGTIADRKMHDNVPSEEKKLRFKDVENLQKKISSEINAGLVGQTFDVLVEERDKGKWRGRTRGGKLIFFDDMSRDYQGELIQVRVTRSSPWSLQGEV